MKASVNGEMRDLPDGITVALLLEMLGTTNAGIAVARNDRVVRRADFDTRRIGEGDRIEIIQAVAGG